MSEEILKALMQLFALIAKQDGGVEDKEKNFVHDFLVQQIAVAKVREYYSLFEEYAGISDQISDLPQNNEIKH
jgi:tellurite resistance protein